jgi:hypothetical protein
MDHATKECEVVNFHWQASDAYAYVRMVQSNLLLWITHWNLCYTLDRCKAAYFHGKLHDSYSMQRREGQVANFHGPCNEGMRGS